MRCRSLTSDSSTRRPVGSSCESDDDCLYGQCTNKTCTAPALLCPTNIPGAYFVCVSICLSARLPACLLAITCVYGVLCIQCVVCCGSIFPSNLQITFSLHPYKLFLLFSLSFLTYHSSHFLDTRRFIITATPYTSLHIFFLLRSLFKLNSLFHFFFSFLFRSFFLLLCIVRNNLFIQWSMQIFRSFRECSSCLFYIRCAVFCVLYV